MTTNFKSINRSLRRGKLHVKHDKVLGFHIVRNAPMKTTKIHSLIMEGSTLTQYCK